MRIMLYKPDGYTVQCECGHCWDTDDLYHALCPVCHQTSAERREKSDA